MTKSEQKLAILSQPIKGSTTAIPTDITAMMKYYSAYHLALIQTVKMACEREECWFMRVAVVTRHLMPSRSRVAQ